MQVSFSKMISSERIHKRSSVVLSIITGVVLLLLLSESCWHLCESLLDTAQCPLCHVLNQGSQGCLLRQMSEVYDYLKRAANAKGLKAVISAVGVVSFVLTYINSARASRVVGIELHRVIRYYYPWCIVFFAGQWIFSACGLYAAECDVRLSAALLLSGATICLGYAVLMAINIVFFDGRVKKRVKNYILEVIATWEKALDKTGKITDIAAKLQVKDRIHLLACRVAEYVNQRYVSRELLLRENDAEPIDVNYLLDIIDKYTCIDLKTEETICDGMTAASVDMMEIYKDSMKTPYGDDWRDYGLILIVPPNNTGQNVRLQKQDIMRSAEIWGILINGIADTLDQARFMRYVLTVSCKGHQSVAFPCGALVYLYSTIIRTDHFQVADEHGWPSMGAFFERVEIEENWGFGIGADEHADASVRRRLAQMALMLLCMYTLDNVMNGIVSSNFKECMCKLIKKEYPSGVGSDDISCFLFFAFQILSALNPSFRGMSRWEYLLATEHALIIIQNATSIFPGRQPL